MTINDEKFIDLNQIMLGFNIDGYKIFKEIKRNVLSRTYVAQHFTDDRIVALRIFQPSLSKNPYFMQQFNAKSEIVQDLKFSNIVEIYKQGNIDELCYIAMEYIMGRDLKNIIEAAKILNHKLSANIILKVTEALNYAYQNDLLHQNVKLSNIMISDEDKMIKLLDFAPPYSLADIDYSSQEKLQNIAAYIAPEQIIGQAVGFHTDMYSLGICFYCLATGQYPFESNNLGTLFSKHLSEVPQNPSVINTKIPSDVSKIILKMLEKDPKNRFVSYDELIKELNLLLFSDLVFKSETPKPEIAYQVTEELKHIEPEKETTTTNEPQDIEIIESELEFPADTEESEVVSEEFEDPFSFETEDDIESTVTEDETMQPEIQEELEKVTEIEGEIELPQISEEEFEIKEEVEFPADTEESEVVSEEFEDPFSFETEDDIESTVAEDETMQPEIQEELEKVDEIEGEIDLPQISEEEFEIKEEVEFHSDAEESEVVSEEFEDPFSFETEDDIESTVAEDEAKQPDDQEELEKVDELESEIELPQTSEETEEVAEIIEGVEFPFDAEETKVTSEELEEPFSFKTEEEVEVPFSFKAEEEVETHTSEDDIEKIDEPESEIKLPQITEEDIVTSEFVAFPTISEENEVVSEECGKQFSFITEENIDIPVEEDEAKKPEVQEDLEKVDEFESEIELSQSSEEKVVIKQAPELPLAPEKSEDSSEIPELIEDMSEIAEVPEVFEEVAEEPAVIQETEEPDEIPAVIEDSEEAAEIPEVFEEITEVPALVADAEEPVEVPEVFGETLEIPPIHDETYDEDEIIISSEKEEISKAIDKDVPSEVPEEIDEYQEEIISKKVLKSRKKPATRQFLKKSPTSRFQKQVQSQEEISVKAQKQIPKPSMFKARKPQTSQHQKSTIPAPVEPKNDGTKRLKAAPPLITPKIQDEDLPTDELKKPVQTVKAASVTRKPAMFSAKQVPSKKKTRPFVRKSEDIQPAPVPVKPISPVKPKPIQTPKEQVYQEQDYAPEEYHEQKMHKYKTPILPPTQSKRSNIQEPPEHSIQEVSEDEIVEINTDDQQAPLPPPVKAPARLKMFKPASVTPINAQSSVPQKPKTAKPPIKKPTKDIPEEEIQVLHPQIPVRKAPSRRFQQQEQIQNVPTKPQGKLRKTARMLKPSRVQRPDDEQISEIPRKPTLKKPPIRLKAPKRKIVKRPQQIRDDKYDEEDYNNDSYYTGEEYLNDDEMLYDD